MNLFLRFRERLTGVLDPVGKELDSMVAQFNAGGLIALGDRPYCIVYNSTTQSVPDSTQTQLQMNSADSDPRGMFSSNAITIPSGEDGVYVVTVYAFFDASAVGNLRIVRALKNTGSQYNGNAIIAQAVKGPDPSFVDGRALNLLSLSGGDVITAWAYQDSGGAMSMGATGVRGAQNSMTVARLW